MDSEYRIWEQDLAQLVHELCRIESRLPLGVLVLGGSMSEVVGEPIGSAHNLPLARRLVTAVLEALPDTVSLAIQGCEHINRALVVERRVQEQYHWDLVDVWPVPEAGGSLAAAAMEQYQDPVVVASVRAEAGLDVGQTLIGMHLEPVAVPVRLSIRQIGGAVVTAARCRPPLIGGHRAQYGKAKNVPKEIIATRTRVK